MKLPARIYHLAEAANWPSIRRHGLFSTSVLLDRAGLEGEARERIERRQRLDPTRLPTGIYVRDQRPLPAEALRRCLVGMEPADWYALINSKVFFWLAVGRLNRQRAACRSRAQVVLVLDTERLVHRQAQRIALTRINSGNARRRPATRGRSSFVPYQVWNEVGWARERADLGLHPNARRAPPVELTVAEGISDLMPLVVGVHRLPPGELFRPERETTSASDKKSPVFNTESWSIGVRSRT